MSFAPGGRGSHHPVRARPVALPLDLSARGSGNHFTFSIVAAGTRSSVPQSETIASFAGGVTGFDPSAGNPLFTFTDAFALREHGALLQPRWTRFRGAGERPEECKMTPEPMRHVWELQR